MFKAMVWDMDGTMSDTRFLVDAMARAYRLAYPDRPKRPFSDFVRCYSMSVEISSEFLGLEKDHSTAFWQELFASGDEAQVVIFPGIRQVLCEVKEAGLILGINTSRSSKEIWRIEQELGELYELFDLVVTADMVEHPKPAPDSLLHFCKETGLEPSQVLFVGDSLCDWHCAVDAGCAFAAAGWGTFLTPQDMPGAVWCQTPSQAATYAVTGKVSAEALK